MNALPLALSLSNSVTEIGAIAAFAALLGIAVLSLLVFSQAREIKRLREWAGRAPERASELEQRVSADASARAQRPGAPPAPGRAVPRKTPLVSAPVSTAVNATVAAAIPGAGNASPGPASATTGAAAVPAAAGATGAVGSAASPTPSTTPADEGKPAEEQKQAAAAQAEVPRAEQHSSVGESQAVAVAGGAATAVEEASEPGPEHPGGSDLKDAAAKEASAPAPATAAARAAGASARAPLPPSPAAPAPPGAASSPAIPSGSIPAAQPPRPASRPPAPSAAARRSVPSRAVAGSGTGVPERSSSSRGRSVGAATDAGARASSARTSDQAGDGRGPKYFRPERSNGRALVLIAGGAIVAVLLIVFAVSALKGGGGSTPTPTQSIPSGEAQPSSGSHTTAQATASNPREIAVVILNGTSTAFLAHHLAADLQQSGYTQAAASAAVPPGTHSTTAVEYTHGHRADAQAVAKTLDVSKVQAIEGSTAALAGSATVVVLAGADQATQLGGGGAQSKGEPAAGSNGAAGEAGATGEGTAGSGN